MYACVHACMYVYMYIYIYIYVHLHTNMYTDFASLRGVHDGCYVAYSWLARDNSYDVSCRVAKPCVSEETHIYTYYICTHYMCVRVYVYIYREREREKARERERERNKKSSHQSFIMTIVVETRIPFQ